MVLSLWVNSCFLPKQTILQYTKLPVNILLILLISTFLWLARYVPNYVNRKPNLLALCFPQNVNCFKLVVCKCNVSRRQGCLIRQLLLTRVFHLNYLPEIDFFSFVISMSQLCTEIFIQWMETHSTTNLDPTKEWTPTLMWRNSLGKWAYSWSSREFGEMTDTTHDCRYEGQLA